MIASRHLPKLMLLAALGLPSVAAAQVTERLFDVAGAPNDSVVFAFLHTLQAAVAADDSVTVSHLVHYPLRVNDHRRATWIRGPVQFQRRYRSIVTPPVRAKILAQVGDSLFASWKGIMIGNGQVWMEFSCPPALPEECQRPGISAINRDAPVEP